MGKHTEDKCKVCGSLEIMPRKTSKYGKICHPCNHAKKKKWAELNPQYSTDWMRKKMTGCTPEMYQTMFTEQNGCCAICKSHQSALTKALSADHCHTTGVIRGLLCGNCNVGLGNFKDSPDMLSEAIKYLNKE